MAPNPDAAIYTLSQACAVAGVNVATGRSWFQRKENHGQPWLSLWSTDQKARKPGATTLISERSVMSLAIAAELVRLGAHPMIACRVGRDYTTLNSTPWVLGRGSSKSGPPDGFTFLAAYPDGAHETFLARKSGADVTPLHDLLFPGGARRNGAWVIFLDFLVKHVELELERLADGRAAP